MRVEEERQLRREGVHLEPGPAGRLDVRDAVGEGKRHLLHRRTAGLADVVAGDRDGVPARHRLPAVREDVRDQPHRRPRREDVGAARDVLLEDVVLGGARQRRRAHALAAGDGDVQGEEDRRGGVDRHRRGHAVERDALEQVLHVLQRGDGHADLAHLAARDRRVRIVTHLCGQVEGDRETGLSLVEQEAVTLVGLRGRAEARILAHRPQPRAIATRVDAARERELARRLARAVGGDVGGSVHALDRLAPGRLGLALAAAHRGLLTAGCCRASSAGWRRAWFGERPARRRAARACRAAR